MIDYDTAFKRAYAYTRLCKHIGLSQTTSIVAGELVSSQACWKIQPLADYLHCSRSAVREILALYKEAGFVTQTRHGYRITPLGTHIITQQFSEMLEITLGQRIGFSKGVAEIIISSQIALNIRTRTSLSELMSLNYSDLR